MESIGDEAFVKFLVPYLGLNKHKLIKLTVSAIGEAAI